MKKLFFILLVSVSLISCADTYKIKGTVSGFEDGSKLTLGILDHDGLKNLDSTFTKGGKFSFAGTTDTAQIAVIYYETQDAIKGCQFFLEKGSIDIDMDVTTGSQHVSGTPNNDAFESFYKETLLLSDEASEIEDKLRITVAAQEDPTDLREQLEALDLRYKEMVRRNIVNHPNLLFGYQQLMDNYEMFEPEEVMEMLSMMAPVFSSDLAFNQLTMMINEQLKVGLGRNYTDFSASLLDKNNKFDKKVSLSQYVGGKNKIIMLDFWASWCAPCLNEIPYIKAAYDKYKSKGFEIVSVSVDDSTEDWINAVKSNNMNWVNLWNGPQEDTENSPAFKYVVSAIPSTFLIDNEGTIIGRNLRGNELEQALEDYFK